MWLRSPGLGIPQDWPSPGQYHDIKTQNHVFDETAIAVGGGYTLTGLSKAIKVDGIEASSSLLPMFGAKPILGRLFTAEEDRPGQGRPELAPNDRSSPGMGTTAVGSEGQGPALRSFR